MNGNQLITGFFAYPSKKYIPEIMQASIEKINSGQTVNLKSWENCRVGGKVIIQEICKNIDEAKLFCADLTTINLNVMFELGYAIAKEKRIWLILDTTLDESKKQFEQLRTLTTIGYAHYCNSSQLVTAFYKDAPFKDLDDTIYRQAIQPHLPTKSSRNIFYLKSLHENEASIKLTRALENNKIPIIINDPQETGVQSLSYYGEKVFSAEGIICHLVNPERQGAWLHNARYALIAGMAFGMKKNLLMLAQGDFLAPVDYRDLLKQYNPSSEAVKYLTNWIKPIKEASLEEETAKQESRKREKMVAALKEIQIGEYVAEDESDSLIEQDYFIETAAYLEALEGKNMIFIGKKGTGKTANFYKLSQQLKSEARNLVCSIKPPSYELDSVVDVFKLCKKSDQKGYVMESLWKYLLYTEIAVTIKNEIEKRPSHCISNDEKVLIDLTSNSSLSMSEDFSVRLERCVTALQNLQLDDNEEKSIEVTRLNISESLHQSLLRELRATIEKIVLDRNIVILIDNLDHPWTKDADLEFLSDFILGLLHILPRIETDFNQKTSGKHKININLVVFLRSDIFYQIARNAREPDKIKYCQLSWKDPELLIRVIEERFANLYDKFVWRNWTEYFCDQVQAISLKEYILGRILRRPRDIVYFVKAAIMTAKNRKHTRVEESDILEAEKQYSQYALDSIVVESIFIPEFENVIYEFTGAPIVISIDQVKEILRKVGVQSHPIDEIISHLISVSFLGVEIENNEFRFAEDQNEQKINLKLAKNFCENNAKKQRYKIHNAFGAYLELRQTEGLTVI